MASLSSCEKLHPCLIKPVPASFETDLPLAKAKPISNSGSTSVITYLRRGKTRDETAARLCEKNYSAHTKVSEEGGRGGAPDAGAEISPAACDEDYGEAGCPPASHGGPRQS